jgi:hypothetical protein
MSSLLDDLTSPTYRVRKGPRCGVAIVLEEMPPDIVAKFTAAMANSHAPSTKIALAVKELGYQVPHDTIQRHRRNACSCDAR